MTLKEKTIHGLWWSFVDNFANLGIQLVAGIILARILTPREFGLMGMLTLFIAVSQSFIDSGFNNALIRKKECTSTDYSTVFYYTLTISTGIFIALFLLSGWISSFFGEPLLKPMIRIISAGLILNAAGSIQMTILTRQINFKSLTRVSVIASSGSGIIAIIMAFQGYGVWSLVAQTIGRYILNSALLWIWSRWKPLWAFSRQSFRELFSFGGNIMLSNLIDTLYRNVYYLIIGKYFQATELGYYTRADQFITQPRAQKEAIRIA